jgi:hypothetical protein
VPFVVSGWIGPAEDSQYLATAVILRGEPVTVTEHQTTAATPEEAVDALLSELAGGAGLDDWAPTPTSRETAAAGLALDDAIGAALVGDMPAVEAAIGRAVLSIGENTGAVPYGLAVEMLRSALVVRPRHTSAAMLLGVLHLEQGRADEALSAFRWVRELSPEMTGIGRLIESLEAAEGSPPPPGVLEAQAMDVLTPLLQPLMGEFQPRSVAAAPFGLVALWDPAKGGPPLRDQAADDPALDLVPTGDGGVEFLPGRVRLVGDGVGLVTEGPATPITSALIATGELTIEALLTPADQAHSGPARIVTLSTDTASRNFTLGQEADRYVLRLRTGDTGEQGTPEVSTPPGTLVTMPQHVVATYDGSVVRLYIDGNEVHQEQRGGGIENWDPSCGFALGNELTLDRQWHGEIGLVAIYARALDPQEISDRAEALLGE